MPGHLRDIVATKQSMTEPVGQRGRSTVEICSLHTLRRGQWNRVQPYRCSSYVLHNDVGLCSCLYTRKQDFNTGTPDALLTLQKPANMPAELPTPDITPAKLPTTSVDCTEDQSNSPASSPLQCTFPRQGVNNPFLYDCDATGDDHPGFSISFPRSEQLSEELAAILYPICQGHINLDYAPAYSDDVCAARCLLQRDIKAILKGDIGRATKLQQNTIIRALTLFSLCRVYATQYLDHSTSQRAVWLGYLECSAIWIKKKWESDVGRRAVKLMEQNYSRIALICDPEQVYGVVHNTYFLTQFARYKYPELQEELYYVEAEPYAWHETRVLRERKYQATKEAEEAEEADT
jgi:hypothetical protein